MGELYEAEDLALGERVALKTIRAEIASDARIDLRFRREVLSRRKVTHPNICRIFDLFQHEPAFASPSGSTIVFVTMELLRRRDPREPTPAVGPLTVERGIADRRHSWPRPSRRRIQVGIVHRDFKPSNIMSARSERSSRDQAARGRHRLRARPHQRLERQRRSR